jgi:poly-gamma-glutamate capsule biosynthesis protein CapA/YwtB (metallophosphatase superfamily)
MRPYRSGGRGLRQNAERFSRTALRARLAGLLLPAGFFALAIWPLACRAPRETRPASAVSYPNELGRVTFAVAGDVIPHGPVKKAAAANGAGAAGWAALFSQVSEVFRKADLGFVNMETPVAPKNSRGSKPFMFNAPVDLIAGLKASGINIVSFANNHVMDQGWTGFAETREHLREQDMLFAGSSDTAAAAWRPVIVEKNGIKIGWLGMTRWLNGNRNPADANRPHVNFFPYPLDRNDANGMDEAGVLAAITRARASCDLLVVSIHWGVEYAPAPRADDIAVAHRMLDAGASVIVGHHPHVVQRVETYRTPDGRTALIFFSLGNFLSNQSRDYADRTSPDREGDPRDAIIGLFSAIRRDYGPAGVRVELGEISVLPVWGENNRNEWAMGRDNVILIRPVLIDPEILRLKTRLDKLRRNGGVTSLTGAERAGATEAANQLKVLEDRRRLLLARTGGDYFARPFRPSATP